MDKLSNYWNTFLKVTEKKTPTILTAFGVLGVFKTAKMAYNAGMRSTPILEASRRDLEDVRPSNKETKREIIKDTVKDMAPIVVPPIAMGIATSACIIGAHKVSSKRIATLSAAYTLTETAFKDYKSKAEEVIGRQKAQQVREAISKDKVEKNPPPKDTSQIVMTGDGDVLCMDSYSGRYFRSNAQKIGSAINQLSRDVMSWQYVSLNDFWDLIGLQRLPMGDDFGWNVDDCPKGMLPISTTAVLTSDGQPCLCVDYDASLRSDFRNLH